MIRLDSLVSPADDGNTPDARVSAVAAIPNVADRTGTDRSSEGANPPRGVAAFTSKDAGSFHLDLSAAGKAMAAGAGAASAKKANPNADIDEADLPDQIKKLLKRIREIREQLRQKQAELQKVVNDTGMQPEKRKMRIALLEGEIMTLTSALMLTSEKLARMISEMKLSQEQAMAAGQLIMA